MAQPIAPDCGQQFLFPPALEGWVPASPPARFLRECVDPLDLPQLKFVMPAAAEGRPPCAPSLVLKICNTRAFAAGRSGDWKPSKRNGPCGAPP